MLTRTSMPFSGTISTLPHMPPSLLCSAIGAANSTSPATSTRPKRRPSTLSFLFAEEEASPPSPQTGLASCTWHLALKPAAGRGKKEPHRSAIFDVGRMSATTNKKRKQMKGGSQSPRLVHEKSGCRRLVRAGEWETYAEGARVHDVVELEGPARGALRRQRRRARHGQSVRLEAAVRQSPRARVVIVVIVVAELTVLVGL